MGEEISTWTKGPSRTLVALGIAELAGAVVLLALAAALPGGRAGFLIGALLLVAGGVALLLLGLRARARLQRIERIRATGQAGTARVTGLRQTGVFMKGQPYAHIALEVTLPGRQPYAAHVKDVVPMLLTGRLTSGDPVPVKVSAGDDHDLIIDWAAMMPETAGPGS